MLSDDGKESLKLMLMRDEGVQFFPYKCTSGKLTIGVGRNLEDRGLKPSEVRVLLENDILYFYDELYNNFSWFKYLDEVRQITLINLAFNLGFKRLLSFKRMLAACEAKDWDKAAWELIDSKYAQQVGDRAKRLAEQLVSGKVIDDGFVNFRQYNI